MLVESERLTPEQRFVYRPAPLGARITVVVRPETVAVEGAWSLDLADIQSLSFFQGRVGDSQMVRLDLQTSRTTRSISINAGRTGLLASEEERPFYSAVIAVLQAVAKVTPQRRVVLGSTGKVERLLFGLGVASVVLGIGLLTGAVMTDVPVSKLTAAAMPFSLLVIVGGVLMRSHWPWRDRVKVPVDVLIDALQARVPLHKTQRSVQARRADNSSESNKND